MTGQTVAAGPTVRFGRLEQRHVILGLTAAQAACLGLALSVATTALYTAGAAGLAATLPVTGPLTAVGVARRDGRALVAWVPVAAQWAARRAAGQTRCLTRPRPRPLAEPVGLALPGDAARLRLLTGPGTGAALVHDPHTGCLTAVLRVVPTESFLLADAPSQARLVDGWGRLIATLAARPALTRLQVLERGVAEPGEELRSWWRQQGVELGSWAARILTDLAAYAAANCERHETYLAVTLDTRRAAHAGTVGRGRGLAGAVAALETEMATVARAVAGADLIAAGWLDPAGLARVVRTAYDPHTPLIAEETGATSAGPVAVAETWDGLRADGAWHAVYWVAEWPRTEVAASFLQPLLLMPGVRRAFSLLAEPLPPARALREIRRAKVEHAADTAQRARLGQVPDEAAAAEADDVIRRERDLADGHADLRFAGLLTVSAPTEAGLVEACGRLEQAAVQAGCDLRRLYGQQAQAFAAAALPLTRGLP